MNQNILKQLAASKRCQILLIALVVLTVYFPALSAEVSLIDDFDMVANMLNSENLSFLDIFIPRSASGGYYRPLLGLSQYIDKQFWLMSSQFMHFENILFHLINSILVFLLALRLTTRLSLKADSFAPLAAALVFALHPVNTESVSWISGRTDSIACNFILVSAIFLFRYRDTGDKLNLVFSTAALLLSLFAKEVAFGYILALPFMFLLRKGDDPLAINQEDSPPENTCHPLIIFLLFFATAVIIAIYAASYWSVLISGCCYMLYTLWVESGKKPLQITIREHLLTVSLLGLVVPTTVALFFLLRRIAFTSNIDRIANTLNLMYQDTGYAISVFLGAAGFYVKKFLWPLPLNFFILEINPLYDLFGIAVFFFVLWLVIRKNVLSVLSIAGMCCALPAFPFAFGTIAWTGYAERYIYISSAFWSIAITLFVARLLATQNCLKNCKKIVNAFVITLLMVMVIITFKRNTTWQTNMALIADTVALNPSQKELRGLYMLAFIRNGDLKSAREQYLIASSLHSIKPMEYIELNMAGVESSDGHKAEAEERFKNIIDASDGKSVPALKFYTKFLENELVIARSFEEKSLLRTKIIPLYHQLYGLNHDPFLLYRLGQIYIAMNNKQSAIDMFERAVQAYPADNMYGVNSAKIVLNLKRNNSTSLKGIK